MKKIFIINYNKKISIFIIIISIFMLTGCFDKQETIQYESEKTNEIGEINNMKVIINDQEYTLNLEDNKTTRELVNMLPLELNMNELNGNEKYVYLDKNLPTNSTNPKTINKGDVMLYGDDCLVIFYKTFNTSYSYTKIGHIDNLNDLGNGSIKVKLDK